MQKGHAAHNVFAGQPHVAQQACVQLQQVVAVREEPRRTVPLVILRLQPELYAAHKPGIRRMVGGQVEHERHLGVSFAESSMLLAALLCFGHQPSSQRVKVDWQRRPEPEGVGCVICQRVAGFGMHKDG